jgi:hypothetical protein
MKLRIKPVHLKIIAAIFIDTFLFSLLLLVSYTFFINPARADYVNFPLDTTPLSQSCNSDMDGSNTLEDRLPYTLDQSANCTVEPSPTNTLEPSATNTFEPSPTNTLEPSATNTLEPSPTNTLEPSATNTFEPSPTNTLEPSPTNTLQPSPTNTLQPSPTNTLLPSATNTLVPPSPTNTPMPSESPTLKPTYTQTSTIEPTQTQSPTNPPPSNTNTPKPSQTYVLSTPKPSFTSTPAVNTCRDCYIVKDFRELIVSGLYTADLLNTEDISSTFKVTITLYDVYKGVLVGKAIDMIDTQPANKVMLVETRLWCINPIKGEVYWINTEASAQKSTGEIWFVIDEWVRINLLDGTMR